MYQLGFFLPVAPLSSTLSFSVGFTVSLPGRDSAKCASIYIGPLVAPRTGVTHGGGITGVVASMARVPTGILGEEALGSPNPVTSRNLTHISADDKWTTRDSRSCSIYKSLIAMLRRKRDVTKKSPRIVIERQRVEGELPIQPKLHLAFGLLIDSKEPASRFRASAIPRARILPCMPRNGCYIVKRFGCSPCGQGLWMRDGLVV